MSLLLPLAVLTSICVSKKNALPARQDSVQTVAPVSAPVASGKPEASSTPVDSAPSVVSSEAVDSLALEDCTEMAVPAPVSYTHLTLPTIYSV